MIKVTYGLSALGVLSLGAMYVVATAMGEGVQVVHMMGLRGGSSGLAYQIVYTTLLFGAGALAVFGARWVLRRPIVGHALIAVSAIAAIMTAIPLWVAHHLGQSASFYERFVGEGVTILALCVLCGCVWFQHQNKSLNTGREDAAR